MVEHLISGFGHFQHNFVHNDQTFFKNLVQRGQKPKIMMISCSDSRVDPGILFNLRPGDVFSVRNVANLVPPYMPDKGHHGVSAALEFGVRDLKVEHIIVLGHAFCGGIQALCAHCQGKDENKNKDEQREFLASWIEIAKPAMQKINLNQPTEVIQHEAEHASILTSLSNLRSFSWIKQKEQSGHLKLHGWWFDMENGALWAADEDKQSFAPMTSGNMDSG